MFQQSTKFGVSAGVIMKRGIAPLMQMLAKAKSSTMATERAVPIVPLASGGAAGPTINTKAEEFATGMSGKRPVVVGEQGDFGGSLAVGAWRASGSQHFPTGPVQAEPAVLLLESDHPEERLPRHLKASNLMHQKSLHSANPDTVLKRTDFPDSYTNEWEHPEDYKLTDTPVWEVIGHHDRQVQSHRTILRACFKVDGEKYVPFSAILDTGCTRPLYVSHKLFDLLLAHNRIKALVEEADCVVIDGTPYLVSPTPAAYQPANVIGRNLLYKLGWGMHIDDQGKEYNTFEKPIVF